MSEAWPIFEPDIEIELKDVFVTPGRSIIIISNFQLHGESISELKLIQMKIMVRDDNRRHSLYRII